MEAASHTSLRPLMENHASSLVFEEFYIQPPPPLPQSVHSNTMFTTIAMKNLREIRLLHRRLPQAQLVGILLIRYFDKFFGKKKHNENTTTNTWRLLKFVPSLNCLQSSYNRL